MRLAAPPDGGQGSHRLGKSEIRQLVDCFGGLPETLRKADPRDKAEVYRRLGLRLVYDHENGRSTPKVGLNHPWAYCLCREGDLNPHAL